ncbi:hypothetical protein FY528_12575 [Hymenobacter lutimineralis]|uniref:Glycerophosphoryl diester phosphodiesterase membrane domain-containing protein n=1 Tax=Hymenobacter lutimineralis TaxID=2606448 RepID=A0A5D6V1M2_9BACT|nr:hypothetical protein [Hymenobacter lutimineralis]TYZ08699.1 hypothetical protein FY528_12575 [Hymenobacter lutimineralis]
MQPTFTKEIEFRQERDFGAKVNATFAFVVAHGRPLGKCLLYIVLPVALLAGLAQAVAQSELIGALGASSTAERVTQLERYSTISGAQLLGFIAMMLGHCALAATIYSYVLVRIALPEHETVTPALVWERVKSFALPLLGSSIVLGILAVLGYLLFIIPGIYLSVGFSLAWAVQVLENRSIGELLSRSLMLIKGKWWSTFGLLVVMYFIVALLSLVLKMPQYLILAGSALHWSWASSPVLAGAMALLSTTASMFLSTFVLVAVMFQYFNLVERKEGAGLYTLVNSIGQGPAPVVQNHQLRPDDEGEY